MTDAMQAARRVAEYSTHRLASGLTVLVRPMPGYSGVHAMYATRFGSVDGPFELDGRTVQMPEGVAHFLEHKMFESEEGDAFALYAKTGANANAFTSFDKTCYIFTATQKVDESLDVLLGMVGNPYFTKETIAKEQGIIGQEIKMYDDSPDWRMLFALCQCLYHHHPIQHDIAGTVESIAQITPELLYDCCDAFYQPANMVLAVTGSVTEQQVLQACARAGLDQERPIHHVKRQQILEPMEIASPRKDLTMSISKPCLGLGYKEVPLESGDLKGQVVHQMLCELVVGGMTPLYRTLYDQGLVNPAFDAECLDLPGCCCVLFTGETDEPEKVRSMIQQEIERLRRDGVDADLFTRCKNQMYGDFLADLENIEDTAGAMVTDFFKGHTLYDEMETLANIEKEDVDEALRTMLQPERSATVIIHPMEEEA